MSRINYSRVSLQIEVQMTTTTKTKQQSKAKQTIEQVNGKKISTSNHMFE